MKDEIDLSGCGTFNEVKAVIDDWIDYYNKERYQWQLARLSPNEYYQYIQTGVYPLPIDNLLPIPEFEERGYDSLSIGIKKFVFDKGYSLTC